MAANKRSRTTYNNPNFKGFVNYFLDPSEKAALKAKIFTDEDFASWLFRYCESGYKFSFSYAEKQSAFQCSATHTSEKHENFGIFLTGRGSTPMKAFKQWMFIHVEVCAEQWPDYLEVNRDGDLDD